MHYSFFKKIKNRSSAFFKKINKTSNINNLKPALFLHIKKTAGSSIVEYARQYYSSVISHGDFMYCKPEELNDIQFISGHFGYEFAKYYIARRYSFVFLRDPVERVLSFYYYCRSGNPNDFKAYRVARENKLEQFLALGFADNHIRNKIVNNQAWQIARGNVHGKTRHRRDFDDSEIQELAINHLDDFSYIGFTETFKEDCDNIIKALGMPIPKLRKKTNVNYERPGRKDISSTTLEIIQEITQIDKIIYDEAWSMRDTKKISSSTS